MQVTWWAFNALNKGLQPVVVASPPAASCSELYWPLLSSPCLSTSPGLCSHCPLDLECPHVCQTATHFLSRLVPEFSLTVSLDCGPQDPLLLCLWTKRHLAPCSTLTRALLSVSNTLKFLLASESQSRPLPSGQGTLCRLSCGRRFLISMSQLHSPETPPLTSPHRGNPRPTVL